MLLGRSLPWCKGPSEDEVGMRLAFSCHEAGSGLERGYRLSMAVLASGPH